MDKEDGDLANLLHEYGVEIQEKLGADRYSMCGTALNCLVTDHKKGYMDLKAANVLYSMKDEKRLSLR